MIGASGRQRLVGLCVVMLGCVWFAVRGYQNQTLLAFDFKPVYSSARCLMDGCDPYDSMQIKGEYLSHGGDASDVRSFRPFNANYPPSALFLVIPLARLPYGPAQVIWLVVGIFLFCCAAMCAADLCVGSRALVVDCVLAVFVATSTMLIMLSQPALYSLSLLVIAVWCFLRQRMLVLGTIAFAVSMTFKPHLGALVWLFFLLAAGGGTAIRVSYRRLALYTLVATLVLMTPGIVLAYHHPASAHWVQELRTNLAGIAAHGNASDPGPTNNEVQNITDLQAVFSLVRDVPTFYNRAALAVFMPLFLAWLYLVMRPVRAAGTAERGASWEHDRVALAAAAALSFLAIYHRQYDTRLLLLMFPAGAVLASTERVRGKMAMLLIALATVVTSHQFLHVGDKVWPKVARSGPVVWLVLYRPIPLMMLALSLFFLYCMAWPERGRTSV